MRLNYCGISDIGLSRSNNEDVWIALPELGFFAVADGMGGHQAGEIAANETIDCLCKSIREIQRENSTEIIHELRLAIEKANRHVISIANSQKSLSGMGTTVCCLLWTPKHIIYAHVGDSRIYRMRHSKLELLTEDHSFLTKWKAYKNLSESCETPYPYKHVITQAIGVSGNVKPTISLSFHHPGDLYFLCTDGLTDVVDLPEIESLINQSDTLEIACEILVKRAKIRRSSDNITLLMIQSEGAHAESDLCKEFI